MEQNGIMNTNEIFQFIKSDDTMSLERLISASPNIASIKLGNLPLLSVAVLFRANACKDLLIPLYRAINAYSENDTIPELSTKFDKIVDGYFADFKNNSNRHGIENNPIDTNEHIGNELNVSSQSENFSESSKVIGEKHNENANNFIVKEYENSNLKEDVALYQEARFVEPVEVALLLENYSLADELLKTVGIKTVSSRKRIESLLSRRNQFTLVSKGDKYCIKKVNAKTNKNTKINAKRFLIYFAFALVIAIMVPVIVLASIKVNVSYIVDGEVYGKEEGISGGKITIKAPQKEGHTFIGWFADEKLTGEVKNKLPKNNSTLYAGWLANSYTITFDCIGYDVENVFEMVHTGEYGTKITIPIPKLEGKLFLGWFDEKDNLLTSNKFLKDLILTPKFVDFSDNSIDNPYEITDQAEMLYLAEQDGYFTIKDGLILDNDFISLGAFTDRSKGFIGNFDGYGKTIYFDSVMPLFLSIGENATVKNLNVVVRNDIKLTDYIADRYGIVAVINSGIMENVTVKFENKLTADKIQNIEISSLWFLNYVGIISGSNSGTINSCFVHGNYELTCPSPYRSFCYSGGLVGANIGKIENSTNLANAYINIYNGGYGGIVGYNSGTVSECKNLGKISVDGKTQATNELINGYVTQCGGIVAVNSTSKSSSGVTSSGNVVNCVNYADISITNKNTDLYLGGIASYNDSSLITSDNEGKLIVNKTEYVGYLGGIVGFTASSGDGKIDNCTNKNNVETPSSGYTYLGGIAGYAISSDSNKKLQIENCINTGDLKNSSQMGGIVGYSKYTALSNCTNEGTLWAVLSQEKQASKVLGGLIGGAEESIVNHSFNCGKIMIVNTGNYNIVSYLGGLIADNFDTTISSSANSGSIVYSSRDLAGLICGVINLSNGKASLNSVYALNDNKTASFYDYNSEVDENGDFVYHVEGDKSKPILNPDNITGLVDSLEGLFE